MKGDFSRNTFRGTNQYSRVLMQQGRVQLDSDWNEQISILLGYIRGLTRDIFGSAAGPMAGCGFRIVTSETLATMPQHVQEEVREALAAEKGELKKDDFLILPGRYYVGGWPVLLTRPIRYSAQTGYPFGPNPVDLSQNIWIAYLDVWEEYVTADQDPYIRESALNGVDTCGRAQVRWQVRLVIDEEAQEAFNELRSMPFGTGRLKARANPTEEQDELCSIEPDARYRGAENQLYRVEIHAGGAAGTAAGATFKWSRDNGSVTFPIQAAKGSRLTLAHLGRDEMTTLVEGDWVELVDDVVTAATGVGLLAQVARVERDDLRVELALPDGSAGLPAYKDGEVEARRAFLRRWDHRGDPKKAGGAIPVAEGPGNEIELEDGVKVTFEEGGQYRPGDYWMIPARVSTGDVEWPGDPDNPEFQSPHGPAHFYAPLAGRLRPFANQGPQYRDMRCCIARLPCAPEAARASPVPGPVPGPVPNADAATDAAAGRTRRRRRADNT